MSSILIVDDEARIRDAFSDLLMGRGHTVITARSAENALAMLETEHPDVVVMDVFMSGMDGIEALQQMKKAQPRVPVIIMTGRGTTELAIDAAKLGAFDYQLKPFDPKRMLLSIDRALECVRLMREQQEVRLDAPQPSYSRIVGQSLAMQEVYKAIGRVAATDATVLIRGESGTGKEIVAQAIHRSSLSAARPLVVVNCVAIPETLLESELFGYERGAFTGAHARRIGKFEQANDGTIFLDEIGDTPLGIQAKILRVLQEKTIERIGGSDRIHVNVRLLAATNKDLEKGMEEGSFREDLFHRLNVVMIRIPALRERRDDIPDLTEYFLDRFSQELSVYKPILTEPAMQVLRSYEWPGNVRELEHCIHRAIIFCEGYPIQASDVRKALEELPTRAAPRRGGTGHPLLRELAHEHLLQNGGAGAFSGFLDEAERSLLAEAMRESDGNQSAAAQLLGLPRPTLHAKLRKHGIRRKVEDAPGLSGS